MTAGTDAEEERANGPRYWKLSHQRVYRGTMEGLHSGVKRRAGQLREGPQSLAFSNWIRVGTRNGRNKEIEK